MTMLARRSGRLAALVTMSFVAATAGTVAAEGGDGTVPSQWPSGNGYDLRIEGWPNAVRFSGADRYQTSLATALALRGTGDFPFDTPDRTSGGLASLDEAADWWGVGACPSAIIVTTGDSPADALAASALSDPTRRSSEPYLQRSAAADPLFNPPGGFAKVDTDLAPVLVTASARSGATGLSTATKVAARDLRTSTCRAAFQAIIVGGPTAVPAEVDDELVALGYDEVFRVSGDSRYDTAAKVAASLGTAAVPAGITGCLDVAGNDGDTRMRFTANSVVEYRESATRCRLLGRTVVLADGVAGADALAAGWWTSYFQVPVLLHDGGDSLPLATANALRTLPVQNLVVLGGSSRISDTVMNEAASLSGATPLRVSGDTRFDTSIEMARRFGGWYPTGSAADFAGSMVCIASSGDQAGWPDALGAGPWCAGANGSAANPGAPARALAPLWGAKPTLSTIAPTRPAHDAVPVLLVPARATALPESVATFLRTSFAPEADWCTSASTSTTCKVPGFAVAFGGESSLPSTLLDEVSSLVSGRSSAIITRTAPSLTSPFFTALDMSPVYGSNAAGFTGGAVCAGRGAYQGARWLAAFGQGANPPLLAVTDVMVDRRYVADADGTARSPGVGAPVCMSGPVSGSTVTVRPVSLSGRVGASSQLEVTTNTRFQMTDAVRDTSVRFRGGTASNGDEPGGGVTELTYLTTTSELGLQSRGTATTVVTAELFVAITRGDDATTPDTFAASWALNTLAGRVTGSASGEAIFQGDRWQLRGRSAFSLSFNLSSGAGGFSATVYVAGNQVMLPADTIDWKVDGVVG